ncbi:energy transducer TonB [candidate division WOR-3 bacterium]|nr:energy transducer TonB [candidate division WOR-3 bacterium]
MRKFDTGGSLKTGIILALLFHLVAFISLPEPSIPVYKPSEIDQRETRQMDVKVNIDFRTIEEVVKLIEDRQIVEIPNQNGGEIIISETGDSLLGNISDSVFLIDTVSLISEDSFESVSEYAMSYEIPPRPIKLQEPDYPPSALNAGIEGTVVLMLWVDLDGKVTKAEVLNSTNPLFDQNAIEAGMGCLFDPAESAGRPVRVKIVFPVNFRLD